MTRFSRVVLASCLVGSALGFEQLAGFKMPSLQGLQKAAQNKAKFGDKKLAIVTGTSSGLGRATVKHLLRTGEYHVIGAVRDLEKMEAVAEMDELDMENFTPMLCDLNDFACVRNFCEEVVKFANDKPLDRLVCNAAVYQPSLDHAKWSKDGIEQQIQSNFLSHFLMISKLMPHMAGAKGWTRAFPVALLPYTRWSASYTCAARYASARCHNPACALVRSNVEGFSWAAWPVIACCRMLRLLLLLTHLPVPSFTVRRANISPFPSSAPRKCLLPPPVVNPIAPNVF
jgi:hypothetical protein